MGQQCGAEAGERAGKEAGEKSGEQVAVEAAVKAASEAATAAAVAIIGEAGSKGGYSNDICTGKDIGTIREGYTMAMMVVRKAWRRHKTRRAP